MNYTAVLSLLIGSLIVETGSLLLQQSTFTRPGMAWRIGFFILLPLAQAVLIGLGLRWAAMICVIYATVGLAMDVATIVQVLTKDSEVGVSLIANIISGLFNVLLIVFGGRLLLGADLGPMPRESHPPNPPFPS
jgi:hypothetical protein